MTASDSEKLLSKVSHPPPGFFDFESPFLKWEDGTYNKTTFKKVYIQADRFPDFLRGERERGLSDFRTGILLGRATMLRAQLAMKKILPTMVSTASMPRCVLRSIFATGSINPVWTTCKTQGTLTMALANTPKVSLVFYTHE